MTDFTKKAIKDTFVELLEEYPLNEITVKSLVKACGINRNSFYYHYHDISSLIDEIIKDIITKSNIEDAAENLLKKAAANGGKDNISIIVCKVTD